MPSTNTNTSQHTSKRVSKKAIRLSIMVAGQSGLGKTTFLSTLFHSLLNPPLEESSNTLSTTNLPLPLSSSAFFAVFAPTDYIRTYSFEMETSQGEKLFIEAIDTPGFSDDIEPVVRLNEIKSHLEKAFDEVFEEEQRIHRNPKFEEHRVHALFYFLEPTGLGLKSFDAEMMKQLSERVNVIPIIAKADGLTTTEKQIFKSKIRDDIKAHEIKIFDFETLSSNTEEIGHCEFPLSIVGNTFKLHESSDIPDLSKRGRPYPWGTVEVDNPYHSDFGYLKKALLEVFRDDLKESTEDSLYEAYRTEKLITFKTSNGLPDVSVKVSAQI